MKLSLANLHPSVLAKKPQDPFKRVYLGTSGGTLPGMINLICIPFDFFHTIVSLSYAHAMKDEEGVLDAEIRLAAMPINLANCSLQLLNIVTQVQTALQFSATTIPFKIASIISGTGLAFCAIEGCFEAINIQRQRRFLSNLSWDSSQQATKELVLQKLTWIQKNYFDLTEDALKLIDAKVPHKLKGSLHDFLCFFEHNDVAVQETYSAFFQSLPPKKISDLQRKWPYLSPEKKLEQTKRLQEDYRDFLTQKLKQKVLCSRKARLARRLQPWFVKEELEPKLFSLLERLKSSDNSTWQKAVKEGAELLSHTKIQAQKKLLVHAVSLTAISLSIAGFATAIVMTGGAPLFLSIAATVVSLGNAFFHAGISTHPGWTFHKENCVPSWFLFLRSLFSSPQRSPSPAL